MSGAAEYPPDQGYVLVGDGLEDPVRDADADVEEDVADKEVMVFLDREEYENDVREGFECGRAAVWKQFFTDLGRQRLHLDGDMVSHSPVESVIATMEETVRQCVSARLQRKHDLRCRLGVDEPLTSGTTSDSGFLVVSEGDVVQRRTTPAHDPAALLSWLAWLSRFAAPLGYLMRPLSTLHHGANMLLGASGQTDEPPPRPLFFLVPEEPAEVTTDSGMLAGADLILSRRVEREDPAASVRVEWEEVVLREEAARRQQRDEARGPPDTVVIPKQTLKNADVIDKVDTLAMFCQQGCLAIVCKMVSKLYAPFDLGYYALDSAACGPVSIKISHTTNDYAHPDLLVKTTKSLQVSRILEKGAVPIGFVKATISLMLFSEQQVEMTLVGTPKECTTSEVTRPAE